LIRHLQMLHDRIGHCDSDDLLSAIPSHCRVMQNVLLSMSRLNAIEVH
jgi:hypothetical protein